MDRSTISNHPMSHAASRTDSLLCHSSNSRRVIASLQMACRIHCIMHRPARSLGAAGITVSELEGRKNNQFTCCWHLATIFTPPPVGERSIVMRMSVCLSVREHISGTTVQRSRVQPSPNFMQWPWLGPPLAALRYVMYFRFYR